MKKYEQAAAWIKNKIAEDGLKDGDRLPGEISMAKELGISRQSVRQAVGILKEQGVLSSVQGSGIYVGKRPDARKAKRKSFKRTAVISTYLDDYIFPGTVRGMQATLAEAGYQVNLFITNNKVKSEGDILKGILQNDDIDGILAEAVKSSLPNPNLELYEELDRRGVKILFFNSFYPSLSFPCVRIDDVQSARDAVRLFEAVGHRKIAGIFKADDGQGHLRYEGYMQALFEAGIEPEEERVIWLDSVTYRQFEKMEDYVFRRLGDSTAVLCYNDELAYMLIEGCLKRGMNLPEQLSVASIDNSYLARICHVPITSYTHPKEGLGIAAAAQLIKMMETGVKGEDIIMKTEVEIRSSIAPVQA